MTISPSEIAIISGTSHPEFAILLAKQVGIGLSQVSISKFADNEISVVIKESVRGKDVFVVQSISLDPNYYLMKLLIIIDALRRASVRSITAVIPYFGYSRQDRKDQPRVPITAKLVANLLVTAGVQHILTMDLHAPQVQGFFDIPVDDLHGYSVILQELQKMHCRPQVVVAPDIGSVKLARAYAKQLNCDFVVIDKQRQTSGDIEIHQVMGSVAGKDVLLADDLCSTGDTMVSAAKACHEKGARHIYAVATHGVFVGNAVAAIEESCIEWMLSTDTIPWTPRLEGTTKIRLCTAAHHFGEAIRCIHTRESISSLG